MSRMVLQQFLGPALAASPSSTPLALLSPSCTCRHGGLLLAPPAPSSTTHRAEVSQDLCLGSTTLKLHREGSHAEGSWWRSW